TAIRLLQFAGSLQRLSLVPKNIELVFGTAAWSRKPKSKRRGCSWQKLAEAPDCSRPRSAAPLCEPSTRLPGWWLPPRIPTRSRHESLRSPALCLSALEFRSKRFLWRRPLSREAPRSIGGIARAVTVTWAEETAHWRRDWIPGPPTYRVRRR